MIENNCYKCKYRGSLPGDAHSKCLHPSLKKIWDAPLSEVLSITGRIPPLPVGTVAGIEVEGNSHGIENGWFGWPFNFDPVWLVSCTGFEQKGTKNDDT